VSFEPEREVLSEFLKRRGLRMTAERRVLFEQIYSHHGHIEADELLRKMKAEGLKISRATVYRNLELLVECGLVRKQRLVRDRHVYEHLHRGLQHDHLVCRSCGRVVEFLSPGVKALLQEICRVHGFEGTDTALQIWSPACSACHPITTRAPVSR
jgi:Fur family ferric uptake transcriptional regulator